jgi:hypothetical protein
MPIQDTLQILIPSAADVGNGLIQTREYNPVIFVNRSNAFVLLQIEKIDYSPSWARVIAKIYESGLETTRDSGSGGTINLEYSITDMEQKTIGLENMSIDTEVRFTIHFRSWQYGEG